jgi:hypothetical protein
MRRENGGGATGNLAPTARKDTHMTTNTHSALTSVKRAWADMNGATRRLVELQTGITQR